MGAKKTQPEIELNQKKASALVDELGKTTQKHLIQPDGRGRILIPGLKGVEVVQVEALNEYEFIVRRMSTVSEREQWLWNNPEAMASVQKGLAEAKAGQFAKAPSMDDDDWLEDEKE